MPKSKEYYKLTGRFYIASAPIQVTRFPPPKIPASELPAADFWENERTKQWKSLNSKMRAVFTWPSRGEVPRSDRIAFSCQSLDVTVQKQFSSSNLAGRASSSADEGSSKTDQLQVVHDIAMDNFCLLVYKINEVEYFDHSSFPPRRTVSAGFRFPSSIISLSYSNFAADIHLFRKR